MLIETLIGAMQVLQAANEQASADEEYQGQGHLQDDERLAWPDAVADGAPACHVEAVSARRADRRYAT